MKRRNYVFLMVVGIVATAFVPLAPCRATWVYLGSDGSSGLPDSDFDNDDGYEYEWSWSYSVTGINRGGDSGGSWAEADFVSDEDAEVWSFGGGTSESADPPNPQPGVWGDSYYADVYPYVVDPIDVSWDVLASGTVTVSGSVDYSNLASGDSVYSSASADGDADGHEGGGGYVSGSVSESSTGSASAGVYGEATNDYDDVSVSSTTYYATLDFTVDAYDSDPDIEGGAGPNSYGAAASLSSYADAYASISASVGYTGSADAFADIDFGGTAIVDVTLP